MIPRRTSVVPPWIVNFGAIIVAKRIRSSNSVLLPESGSANAARCALCWILFPFGSKILNEEPQLSAPFRPAASRSRRRMRRSVWTCGQASNTFGTSGPVPRPGHLPVRARYKCFEKPFRPTALIRQLACRLFQASSCVPSIMLSEIKAFSKMTSLNS